MWWDEWYGREMEEKAEITKWQVETLKSVIKRWEEKKTQMRQIESANEPTIMNKLWMNDWMSERMN